MGPDCACTPRILVTRNPHVATLTLRVLALVAATIALPNSHGKAQQLDRGHRILMQRGLQVQASWEACHRV